MYFKGTVVFVNYVHVDVTHEPDFPGDWPEDRLLEGKDYGSFTVTSEAPSVL